MRISKEGDLANTEALKVLRNGGLVIAPSDTVYGALVDATNEEAVKKLIQFKNRPWGKPISVFVSGNRMLEAQVVVKDVQRSLLMKLLPGPFTIIFDSKHNVCRLLESEKGSLGVRLIKYPFIHKLVGLYGKPITATSANLSGHAPHHSIASLIKQFPQKKKDIIDLIVDAGQLPRNKPSTVIDMTQSKIKIMRKGEVTINDRKNVYISSDEQETKKIAQDIYIQNRKVLKEKPLVFILEGEMGAGKTIFAKGIGELHGITDMTSPTFVILHEYEVHKNEVHTLVHGDFFNIEEQEELRYLGLEPYLEKGNICIIEWGERSGDMYNILTKTAHLIHIKLNYLSETKREIII